MIELNKNTIVLTRRRRFSSQKFHKRWIAFFIRCIRKLNVFELKRKKKKFQKCWTSTKIFEHAWIFKKIEQFQKINVELINSFELLILHEQCCKNFDRFKQFKENSINKNNWKSFTKSCKKNKKQKTFAKTREKKMWSYVRLADFFVTSTA